MTASFYDVIVLGSRLAPLTCAALLAKRGFRVLVLGQGEPPPSYELCGHQLPDRPFTFLTAQSPVLARVLSELGLTQSYRRLQVPLDPAYQVALPDHRYELSPQHGAVSREFEREFPEVKRPLEDFHAHIEQAQRDLDELLQRDLTWPPETFLERREFNRALSGLGLQRRLRAEEPLAELPETHPFRIAARLPAHFEGCTGPDAVPPLALYRLYGNRHLRAVALEGGIEAYRELLIQKVKAHSGTVELGERAVELMSRRGAAGGVRLFGSGDELSSSFVISGVDTGALQRLRPDRSPLQELYERMGEPQLRLYRHTTNLLLAPNALPQGMGRDVFYVAKPTKPLEGEGALRIESERSSKLWRVTVESLLPARWVEDPDGYLKDTRERVLRSLRGLIPFLDQHLKLVDSPHDGRPPDVHDPELQSKLPPQRARPAAAMEAVYGYPVHSVLDLCAMPIRTPLRHLLLCNGQVAPGLGREGELLTGYCAARVVTRADKSKAWMRRGLWTKVEI